MKVDKKYLEKQKTEIKTDFNFDMNFNFDFDQKAKKVDVKSPNEVTQSETDMHEMVQELTAEQKAFREQLKSEKSSMDTAVDSGFWCCICFVTYDHKMEFLQKTGLQALGDKYIDGHKFAKALGIELTTSLPKKPNMFKERKNFATLVNK